MPLCIFKFQFNCLDLLLEPFGAAVNANTLASNVRPQNLWLCAGTWYFCFQSSCCVINKQLNVSTANSAHIYVYDMKYSITILIYNSEKNRTCHGMENEQSFGRRAPYRGAWHAQYICDFLLCIIIINRNRKIVQMLNTWNLISLSLSLFQFAGAEGRARVSWCWARTTSIHIIQLMIVSNRIRTTSNNYRRQMVILKCQRWFQWIKTMVSTPFINMHACTVLFRGQMCWPWASPCKWKSAK